MTDSSITEPDTEGTDTEIVTAAVDRLRRFERLSRVPTRLPAGLSEAELLCGYPTLEQKAAALLLGAQLGGLFCVLFGVGPWAVAP